MFKLFCWHPCFRLAISLKYSTSLFVLFQKFAYINFCLIPLKSMVLDTDLFWGILILEYPLSLILFLAVLCASFCCTSLVFFPSVLLKLANIGTNWSLKSPSTWDLAKAFELICPLKMLMLNKKIKIDDTAVCKLVFPYSWTNPRKIRVTVGVKSFFLMIC